MFSMNFSVPSSNLISQTVQTFDIRTLLDKESKSKEIKRIPKKKEENDGNTEMDRKKTILSAFSIHCEWSPGIEHCVWPFFTLPFFFFFFFLHLATSSRWIAPFSSFSHSFIISNKFYSLFMRIGHRSVIVRPTPSNLAIHYPYYIVLCAMCVVRCALCVLRYSI